MSTPWVEANARRGEELEVCGHLFATGTPVVLWHDQQGYDAYRTTPFFPSELGSRRVIHGRRYALRSGFAPTAHGPDTAGLKALRDHVDQMVIHFDVCGTSRQCFKVLHDIRKLSVHFMLDVDGTIYQSLDLRERAFHATVANDRSIGIEIAHIGAYPNPKHRMLGTWYTADASGPRVRFPKWMKTTGVRTADFIARPARSELVHGVIQGKELWQYDFTAEQYRALGRLVRALSEVFPKLRVDYPRDSSGALVRHALSPDQLAAHRGLLGHFHVQRNKTDPGPAFDWERLLREAGR
ncbi:MAG: N-acetylmuramoyl-L-alanine amidase [Planctomycetes bacterium]|nr:N-acetylmuramoyl-L-alanine amidase [Planctomycetota bacterium]MCB9869975.1 N-acetylmuramoyl-L-alanine amidase [Planctomycetota bacterium]